MAGRLTLDDLGKKRIASRDGRTYTIAWCLLHALEHTGLHLGHMQLTRQLWERRGKGLQGGSQPG